LRIPAYRGISTAVRLRKIGERGILVIKDFTSILSTDRNVRAAMLAALRARALTEQSFEGVQARFLRGSTPGLRIGAGNTRQGL
jgi:hypothetical protein